MVMKLSSGVNVSDNTSKMLSFLEFLYLSMWAKSKGRINGFHLFFCQKF